MTIEKKSPHLFNARLKKCPNLKICSHFFQADPGLFWQYFFSALSMILLILILKSKHGADEPYGEHMEVSNAVLIFLSVFWSTLVSAVVANQNAPSLKKLPRWSSTDVPHNLSAVSINFKALSVPH